MNVFKVGDKVVCIDNGSFPEYLDIGKIYLITKIEDHHIYVVGGKQEDDGHNNYLPRRFRPATLLEKELADV